ncbi:MAG: C-GCAxxG-C-C family protein [Bacteroidales bacterium]|nr:C_GCAxxG_C_C family protein [Lentimicrobiaceae bacterium]MDD5695443.1 C-GCAxxG-C-C family protein [Bacteroidales bacterium]
MKDYVRDSLERFESGHNCAQAVVAVFSDELGLRSETALKVAKAFGGGMAGYGKTCGALTGAMMVIGLRWGSASASDGEANDRVEKKTHQLVEEFEKKYGTSNCNELLGLEAGNLSGTDVLLRGSRICQSCHGFIETVVAFLEEEIES